MARNRLLGTPPEVAKLYARMPARKKRAKPIVRPKSNYWKKKTSRTLLKIDLTNAGKSSLKIFASF